MDNTPSPPPEVLKPRTEEGAPVEEPQASSTPATPESTKKRRAYRPSHKATFIAFGVIAVILAVNAAVIGFVLKNKSETDNKLSGQVTISADVLSKIGVEKTPIGSSGVELTVDPNAKFNGAVSIGGDTSIGGQLKLNGKFSVNEGIITQLTAGNTSLSQLDVNGNTTVTNATIRNTLAVAGATQLQGAVTVTGLMTVNNSLNVAGNVAIGGTLTVSTFTARTLVSTSTLTIGGHIMTTGLTPAVGPGSGLGSNGTVGISGNDAAGTVSINVGVGASGGTLASVAFKTQYTTVPRIVVSAVGVAGNFYITNASVAGFTISVASGLPPGGYTVNYIVFQ